MIEAAAPSQQNLHDLYRDHRGWLESWLRRRMGNAWDAADLSQDTFMRVLSSAQPLADIQEPRAYLQALAQLPEESVPSPEQRWLLLETLQALDELLDGLPRPVRRAFLWSQLEGLGYREIAERLQVSERTVKRYMAQAYEHCLLVDL